MATTTAKAFADFLTKLEPTSTDQAVISGRSTSVSGYLKSTFDADSDMPLVSTSVIGSGAKGTGIRPVEDVDILAVFGNAQDVYNKYAGDSKQFLYRVKNALDGYRVDVVGARGQAVRLFYTSGPHADIAPVLPVTGGGYYLPAGDGSWVFTNPAQDLTWLNERNAALNHQVKPLVKLAKAWNRTHSRRLRSFHLEVMVASAFTSLGSNHRQALKIWFAYQNITVAAPTGGQALDGYMPYDSTRRNAAINVMSSSAERATNALAAEDRGDHAEAIRLWQIILGSDFPAYG
jgi:hypothetical protein